MDYTWSETQQELYGTILEFSQSKIGPALTARPTREFPRDLWSACGEQGLLGLSVPEDYGGLGQDALTTARVMEAFGEGCADMGFVFSAAAHLFAVVMPIVEGASEELKQRLLPRLASGEWVGGNAITESGAGSDVFALKARATRDGDDYLITGEKTYVTNGPVADVFLVYATTNPSYGYLGVTAFAVERDRPGIVVGQPFEKMGLHTSPISSVYFEECRIPAANRVGEEGQGGFLFRSSMQWERSCLFAGYVGAMARQLDQVVEYAKARKQFGRAIGKNQAISHRIADMKLRLESARLLLYRACWKLARGEDAVLDVSMAKLAISEGAIQSGLDTIHIFGGIGVTKEAGVEAGLRDAVPCAIFSGTSEMQRDLIASRLGL